MRARLFRMFLIATIVAAVVGQVGTAATGTTTDQRNQVSDWCDDDGVKFDNLSGASYTVPDPPAGTMWTLLVIKSATDNETWVNPVPGQTYTPSNGHDVSHVILCYDEITTTTTTTAIVTTTTVPETTTTTVPETTTTTIPETTTTTTVVTTTTTVPETTTTTDPPEETTTSLPSTIESGDGGYIDEGGWSFWEFAAPAFFLVLLAWAFAEYQWAKRREINIY